jgi:hypothetical protein
VKYLLLSAADCATIVDIYECSIGLDSPRFTKIIDRLRSDTGGDFEDIAETLKRSPICPPCEIEGFPDCCESLLARKLGRRLARLIERAK